MLIYKEFCWWFFNSSSCPVLKTNTPKCSINPDKAEDQWSCTALSLYRWVNWRLEWFSDLTVVSEPVHYKTRTRTQISYVFTCSAFFHAMLHNMKIVVTFVGFFFFFQVSGGFFLTLTGKIFATVINDQQNQSK